MRSFILRLTALALCAVPASLHASTILNENFNELTTAFSATSVGAFTAINGTDVDIVGPTDGFGALCAGPESGNCIDMDGSSPDPAGQLRSNMLFSAGTYLLSFDLVGNGRGAADSSTTVTLGNYSQTFLLASADITDGIVVNQSVTVTTPGYLYFDSNDSSSDEQGNVLDNVTVDSATSTTVTPEPSSFVLLGSGLLALAGTIRRRLA